MKHFDYLLNHFLGFSMSDVAVVLNIFHNWSNWVPLFYLICHAGKDGSWGKSCIRRVASLIDCLHIRGAPFEVKNNLICCSYLDLCKRIVCFVFLLFLSTCGKHGNHWRIFNPRKLLSAERSLDKWILFFFCFYPIWVFTPLRHLIILSNLAGLVRPLLEVHFVHSWWVSRFYWCWMANIWSKSVFSVPMKAS